MNRPWLTTVQKRLIIVALLTICFGILLYLAFDLHPSTPFAAYMPMDLWIVSSSEAAAARAWIGVIFGIYVAIGIVSLVRASLWLAFVVPIVMAASLPIAFMRVVLDTRGFY